MHRLLILILLLFITSCAPVIRFATDTLNNQTGDEATLTFVIPGETQGSPCVDAEGAGLCFDPGSRVAEGALVDVQADELTSFPDVCVADTNGADCSLGNVSDPYFIPLSGTNVSGTVNYRRSGSTIVLHELVRR